MKLIAAAFAVAVGLATVAFAGQSTSAVQPSNAFGFPIQQSDTPSSFLPEETLVAQACCKICRKGKACGDTCIAKEKECHQPPGCACNG